MTIERVLSVTSTGALLGGLSWRAPRGGVHTLRQLHDARALAGDATHYTVFSSGATLVYGLYQPRPSEELERLPKGLISAAHCFAALVGRHAPNGALLLTLPGQGAGKDPKVYVVVLEGGVPVVDLLTTEAEARNALGSEERRIWTDAPAVYPLSEAARLDWLNEGATKAARVVSIPANPWPWVIAVVLIAAVGTTWFTLRQARLADAHREQASAAAAADPVPRYRAALAAERATLVPDRPAVVDLVRHLFDTPVQVPGWSLRAVECDLQRGECESTWLRRGGTFAELERVRPGERLTWVSSGGNPVPAWDLARTTRPAAVVKRSASRTVPPPALDAAWREAGSLFQVWRTADLSVDMGPPELWPKVPGMSPRAAPERGVLRGSVTVADVPGPFILEALRTAPAWMDWHRVRADIADGDTAGRLKFKATGVYHVSLP